MQRTLPVFFLFIVIILEGYVVLSSELLAIRQSIPFVGSGTDTVSIIIAAVLMPLAFGYQAGGEFRPTARFSIRKKLIRNLFTSMCILLPGLSYPILTAFFTSAVKIGIENRLILTSLYAGIFIVIPVYLLGQTIPLISNYFSKERLAKVTGKILFFSTLGSFCGAVISTLVLMATIGVHYTAALNFIILAGLIIALSKNKFSEIVIIAVFLASAALYINSDKMMAHFNIVENNQYNTIAVFEKGGARHLVLNNNASSKYGKTGGKHKYVEFIEETVIDPTLFRDTPADILVIGAGAFTLGFEDEVNHYDYVDIDKSLKRISEEHILKTKLKENKTFHPVPARAYLSASDKNYDVIVLDAFLGDLTLPEHLVTQEFFQSVKTHLKPGGVMAGNFITSPNFANAFSRNIDATMRSVFPSMTRVVIKHGNKVWNTDPNIAANIVYLYTHHEDADAPSIYTDNKNRVFYDKPRARQSSSEEKEN